MCFAKSERENQRRKHPSAAGLPDGLFSDQKSQFGYIVEGLGMEK
jgi:hypothetical protein